MGLADAQKKILIVEDAVDLAEGLAMNLRHDGFMVETVYTGIAAVLASAAALPDLMLLDIMLPDMTGLAVLEAMRNIGFIGAVVVISGLSSPWDQKVAHKLGAVDYVTKPFDLPDLLEVVRRAAFSKSTHDIIDVDRSRHAISVRGDPVHLTPKEFDLLAAIVEARGRVVTRTKLLEGVWGIFGAVHTTTLDSHIKQIRMKLDPFGLRHAVVNVPKIGFKWFP